MQNYSDKDLVDILKRYEKEKAESHIAYPNRKHDIEVSFHNRAFELLKEYAKL